MAYTLDISLTLGAANTGIASNLRAQLVDTTGADTGAAVSTGFVEIGTSGNYLWHYASFPDGHRGGVKFYDSTASSTILAFVAINPQEAEYTDAKTSTRSTLTAGGVRTELATELGRIDATVSSRSTLTAADVWNDLTSGHTTVGSIGKRIVDYLTGDSYARLGAPNGASISADISQTNTNTSTLMSRLSSARAGYLDNLNGLTLATIVAGVWDYLTSAATTVGSLGKLLVDMLNAAVGSRSSHSAADVWAAPTRTLTSSGAITADDIADIADAVWDEPLSGHATAGTSGKGITDLLADHDAAGTGSVTVDHHTGGTDALSFQTSGGIGIDGGIIRAYLTADVSASGYSGAALRGRTTTNALGRWTTPMYLDAGAYTLVYATSDEVQVTTKAVTVSA